MATIDNKEGMQRRFGFVSVLWWIAFTAGIFDTVQNQHYTWFRLAWMTVAVLLASFFTWTWWKLKKGSL
ncbi:MAG TPA: hypothetical protein VEG32_01015 [Clostridia bacterium]|nr:hypothetical protein [Clostridia bacterium]